MAKAPVPQTITGKCSTFGGERDKGVAPGEGLAMLPSGQVPPAPDPRRALFLSVQPIGTRGLARRLDDRTSYLAFRFPESMRQWLKTNTVELRNPKNGRAVHAWVVDWGPHVRTGRTVDLSPGAAAALGVETDDEVQLLINGGS